MNVLPRPSSLSTVIWPPCASAIQWRDRQAEPRSAVGSRPRRIGAIEALEQVRQVFGGDADAGVLDAQRRPAGLAPSRPPSRVRRATCSAARCQPG